MNTDLFDFSEEDKASIERSWQYWLDTGAIAKDITEEKEKVFDKKQRELIRNEKINQLQRLCRGVNSSSRANIKPAPVVIFVKENQDMEEAPINEAISIRLIDRTHIIDLPCEVDREHIIIDYLPAECGYEKDKDKNSSNRFSRAKVYLDDMDFIKESCEIEQGTGNTGNTGTIHKGMKIRVKNKEYNEIYLLWKE